MGYLGLHELEDLANFPEPLWCALSPADLRAYDTSHLGTLPQRASGVDENNFFDLEDGDSDETEDSGAIAVRNLSLDHFRSKLGEHFAIK